jgi:Regulator of chromosome condensation (RCC1) repeat
LSFVLSLMYTWIGRINVHGIASTLTRRIASIPHLKGTLSMLKLRAIVALLLYVAFVVLGISIVASATTQTLRAPWGSAASGTPHVAISSATGDLYTWGDNSAGELGIGVNLGPDVCANLFCSPTPSQVSLPAGKTAVSVAGGGWFGLALMSDGTAYGFGWNGYGDIGDGSFANSATPEQVAFPSDTTPVALSAGGYFGTALMNNGSVMAWGYGDDGELGSCALERSDVPVNVRLPPGVTATDVSAGFTTAGAVGSDGAIYLWGQNNFGQLGDGTTTNSSCPEALTLPGGLPTSSLSVGTTSVLALAANGQVFAWGDSASGSTPSPATLPAGISATEVLVGNDDAFMIGSDGDVYEWPSWPPTNPPSQVSLPPGVSALGISSGVDAYYILGSDGNLYAWGSNPNGQLGNGTTSASPVPTKVLLPPGTSAAAMSGGAYFGLVVLNSGGAPAITSPSAATFILNKAGSFTVQSVGNPSPVVRLSTKLPKGLKFRPRPDGTATISGTVGTLSSISVSVRATNSSGSVSKDRPRDWNHSSRSQRRQGDLHRWQGPFIHNQSLRRPVRTHRVLQRTAANWHLLSPSGTRFHCGSERDCNDLRNSRDRNQRQQFVDDFCRERDRIRRKYVHPRDQEVALN